MTNAIELAAWAPGYGPRLMERGQLYGKLVSSSHAWQVHEQLNDLVQLELRRMVQKEIITVLLHTGAVEHGDLLKLP